MLLARNKMFATVSYLFDGMLSYKHYLFYSLSLIISCILLKNRNCGHMGSHAVFQRGPCCSSFYFHVLFLCVLYVFVLRLVTNVVCVHGFLIALSVNSKVR